MNKKITLIIAALGMVAIAILFFRDHREAKTTVSSADVFRVELRSQGASVSFRVARGFRPEITTDSNEPGIALVFQALENGSIREPSVLPANSSASEVTISPDLVPTRIYVRGRNFEKSRSIRDAVSKELPFVERLKLSTPINTVPISSLAPLADAEYFALLGNDGKRASYAVCDKNAEGVCHVLTDLTEKVEEEYWFSRKLLAVWPILDANIGANVAAFIERPEDIPDRLANPTGEAFDPNDALATYFGVPAPSFSTEIVGVVVGQTQYDIPRNYFPSMLGIERDNNSMTQMRAGSLVLYTSLPQMTGLTKDTQACIGRRFACDEFIVLGMYDGSPINSAELWARLKYSAPERAPELDSLAPQMEAYRSTTQNRASGEYIHFKPYNLENEQPIITCFKILNPNERNGYCDVRSLRNGMQRESVRFSPAYLARWPSVLERAKETISKLQKKVS